MIELLNKQTKDYFYWVSLKSCISIDMDLTEKKWLRTLGWILLVLAIQ